MRPFLAQVFVQMEFCGWLEPLISENPRSPRLSGKSQVRSGQGGRCGKPRNAMRMILWNIFDETENYVMYEVQNFLSATSIFVEKFLLNIFAAAEGILCQKFVNSSHFKLYHPIVIF